MVTLLGNFYKCSGALYMQAAVRLLEFSLIFQLMVFPRNFSLLYVDILYDGGNNVENEVFMIQQHLD